MKIHQLSKLSHVNTETIRMYRKKGMLIPEQNQKNGYYEYSMADFFHLLYIRKLRGSNLPLHRIAYTYTHTDLTDIISRFESEMKEIDEQIEELEKQKFLLQVTLEHLIEHKKSFNGAAVIESPDDKYDRYFTENLDDPELSVWIRNIELFTQTIGISKEILTLDELPERIPICPGLGTYRNIFLKSHMALPEHAAVFPKGTYVAANIELEHFDFIHRDQLTPVLDYIRTHNYRIDSGTTAFLFRVDCSGRRLKFLYRLRIKVIHSPI